jgi:serine/threonine protein kinase
LELLQQLLADRLSGPAVKTVEVHVETCACCQAALERLTSDSDGPNHEEPPTWDETGADFLRHLENEPPTGAWVSLGIDARMVTWPCFPAGPWAAAAPPVLPTVAGYELLGEIGRGGMGVVYKARQVALHRLVALKMIRASGHAAGPELARFRAEAEAVGRLQHPNIVQIFEVGQQNGLPYFSLEFCGGGSLAARVNGTPLPPGEAAALVETLARAMHVAHERGIVHRDLKPANILLAHTDPESPDQTDARGEISPAGVLERYTPKITDFGLAKKIRGERGGDGPGGLTESGFVVGTPSYMAPEQARGQVRAIGPAADVYALGAILYECLTGRPPFRGPTPLETLQLVVHEEPVPVRQLQPRCPRDLETICHTCLHKEPARRYGSAAALTEDLRRYRAGEPIQARPVGVLERGWRWCGRNPLVASSLAAVLLTLVLCTAVAWWFAMDAAASAQLARDQEQAAIQQQRTAEAESKRADQEKTTARLAQLEEAKQRAAADLATQEARAAQKRSEAVVKYLVAALRSPDPALQNSDLKVTEALDAAVQRLKTDLPEDTLTQAELFHAIGLTYLGVGEAQKAIAVLESARQLRESKLGADDPTTLTSINNLALAYLAAGQPQKALPLFEETLAKFKATLGPDHILSLGSMHNLASAYRADHKLDLALPLYLETLEKMQAKLGPDHADTLQCMSNLAEAYREAGQPRQALQLLEPTLEKRKVQLGPDHPHTLVTQHDLALAYQDDGQRSKALLLLEETLEKLKAKLRPDHPHTLATIHNLAGAYQADGQLGKALPLFEATLEKRKAKLGPDHPDTLTTMNNLATAYWANGQLNKALPLFETTLEKRKAKLGPDHPATLTTMNNLAVAYWSVGKLNLSIPLFEEILAKHKAKLGPDHPVTLLTLANLGVNYRDAGRLAEAIPLLEEALQRARKRRGPIPAKLAWIPATLAATYEQAGQYARAEPLYRELVEQSRKQFGAEDLRTTGPLAQLGENLLRQKKYAEAEVPLRQSVDIYQKQNSSNMLRYHTESLLGAALAGQQKFAEAEPLLLSSAKALLAREAQLSPAERKLLRAAIERVIDLYDAWGQAEEAARWRQLLERTAKDRGGQLDSQLSRERKRR